MATANTRTVSELLLHRVASTPDASAFMFPDGSGWKTLSWRQFGEGVKQVAMGLRAIGLKNEERCAIVSGTRYDWVLADIGILCAGGATTTIYPSSTADDAQYIINDSQTVFVFAENDEQVQKLASHRASMPTLKQVIVIDGKASADGWVISFADLMEKGKAASQAEFETVAKAAKPESLATLIYTSGTTGRPKGVELTHDCWIYEGEAIEALGILQPNDVQYLWLPLAHSFGKVLELAQLRIGFLTAIDGRVDKLVENLGFVKPTFVAAVPRIFEKVYNKVVQGAQASPVKYKIFKWSIGVGRQVSAKVQAKENVGGLLGIKNKIADKLVFSKLKARFGGRLKYFVSGSAPLSREIAEFFHAAGILILEGYGLTETSAASFVNRPDKYQFGTVGPPVQGTELKIASDGEILIRGRGVMRGYHNLKEQTAETIQNGWLHTGDIGELTPDGMLRITDRKKDLIKTSAGKYVAPQALEGKLKASCPYISQVLIHGNNRNFVSALIALDPEAINAWAKEQGMAGAYAEIVKDAKTLALIKPFMDQLNSGLANFESVKKWAILPADLTADAGDLTPSLKLKRKAVETKYKALLDGFYAGATAEV